MSKSKSVRSGRRSTDIPLRCRKGDLAILLSDGPSAGFIVDVVKYYGTVEMEDGEVLVNAWHIRHPSDEPGWQFFTEDQYLLPIRPGDLDETETEELSLVNGRSA